ncbi:MAG: phosphatase PAP2 family protein [Actinobacteria bacterium]|nr:phosphatase PAP2 family protein [Actinomycetota bacterium]
MGLDTWSMTVHAPTSSRGGQLLAELSALDLGLYEAVARTDTPMLDGYFRRLSMVADKSVLWLAIAGVIAVLGGPTGRWAALNGVASIGLASAAANLVGKRVTNRRRPDRAAGSAPDDRQVPMPDSTSFPSGHTASAFAFAEGVGRVMPALGGPLRLAAVAVGYSRVHVGVHYPGDVAAGALIGRTAGEAAPMLLDVVRRRAASTEG